MSTDVRIPPLTPAEMTPEERDKIGPWKDLVFSQVLMRHPKMYDVFLPYLKSVVADTILPQRDRQIVCLYMLQLANDVYEKTHHVEISYKVGLGKQEVEQILAGGGPSLDDWDHTVIGAVEELYRDQKIGDATWARLGERYSREQSMELVFLGGCYLTMAMLTKSFGMQLEADLESFNKNRDYTEEVA
jgi:hypothetical protein